MDESGLDENGQLVFFVVKKMLEAVQTLHHALRWRRNERSVSRSGVANPVLGVAKFAGCFVRAASPTQQHSVNLPDEPQRKWKTVLDATKTMLHRRDIIRDLRKRRPEAVLTQSSIC